MRPILLKNSIFPFNHVWEEKLTSKKWYKNNGIALRRQVKLHSKTA